MPRDFLHLKPHSHRKVEISLDVTKYVYQGFQYYLQLIGEKHTLNSNPIHLWILIHYDPTFNALEDS